MRPWSLCRAVVRVSCLALFACGPTPGAGDGGGDGDDGGGDELASACHELFAQRVAHDMRCIGQAPAASDEAAYVESCIAIVGAPGATLVAADVAACAAHLETDECLAFMVEPGCVGYGADLLYPEHDRPGTRSPGDACMTGVQCASGYCSAIGEACGQCQRLRERGESCAEPSDLCLTGWCIAGVCDLVGAPAGAECVDYGGGDCQADLMCRPIDPGEVAGICVARGGAGAPCEDMGDCVAGHYCADQVCAPQLPDGAECPGGSDACVSGECTEGGCGHFIGGIGEGADCSSGYCRPDLSCDAGVCRKVSVVPLGGDCSDYSACVPGLYCQGLGCTEGLECPGIGTCADLPGVGAPCTEIATCAPGAVCLGFGFDEQRHQTGTCARRGGIGEACPCGDQLTCVGDVCAAYDPAVCG